jgi:formylglycine-generating enzyme required for sulfatase activity
VADNDKPISPVSLEPAAFEPGPASIAPSSFEPLAPGAQAAQRQKRPVRWLLLTAAIGFALIMLYLFMARSVEIKVDAETESDVDVSGLFLPFGERMLILQGDYAVTVTAPGYHPEEVTLVVGEADSQTLEITLRPLPGLLDINSTPAGAAVLIDGEEVGVTPITALPVEAGEHQLALAADRYLPLAQALSVTGRQVQQQLELSLAPAWAEISINSTPADATVLMDGEPRGNTPATLEILQGEHQLLFEKAGFAPLLQDIEVVAGTPQALATVSLVPAAGLMDLSSAPSGANVTMDGEFQGQTPLTLELSPGRSHRLSVSRAGYRRYNVSVELAAGETLQRKVDLVAQLGEVVFRISPPEAMLRVDGKPRGKGNQTLSLPAFEHTVEVSLAGHASVRQRVTPRPGLQQVVEVSLQTEQSARMSRITPEVTTALGQTLLLFTPADSPRSEFTMGASRREPGRRANEVMHTVRLQRMFYLQTTEVTNAQFRQFQAQHNSGQIEGKSLNREHQPAVQLSWQQATQFCNWLSRKEGLPPFYRETSGIVNGYNPSATGYRLPTEAEWAWAARVNGEQLLKFPWGDTFPPNTASENYADNTSAYVTGRILSGYTDGHVVSATVASFTANHNGLYDMGGNVAEWVHDAYSIPSANGAASTDPLGPQNGDNFVIRGASWSLSQIAELRLSYRDYGQAGRDDVGFRIARYAE